MDGDGTTLILARIQAVERDIGGLQKELREHRSASQAREDRLIKAFQEQSKTLLDALVAQQAAHSGAETAKAAASSDLWKHALTSIVSVITGLAALVGYDAVQR
jgi:hypothetical protein